MRVLYDGQIFSLQPYGGVNRYFKALIETLPSEVEAWLICNKGASNLPTRKDIRIRTCTRFAFRPGRIALFLEREYFSTIARLANIDVIHPSYYYLLFGHTLSRLRCPIVVTLYDMLHEIFPETIDPMRYHSTAKRAVLERASRIICISERTRRDLAEYYPDLADRAVVIPLAAPSELAAFEANERVCDAPYFLYVGQRCSYKNFPLMLRAFRDFLVTNPGVKLVVTGPSFNSIEREMIQSYHLSDALLYCGDAQDAQLASLYRHSIALIYPSLYEGFGLPPLEAMSCGAPVVCAASAALPEVVGDAALFFDPRSQQDLCGALCKLFSDEALRAALIERGAARVHYFTYDKVAKATAQVYREVLGR